MHHALATSCRLEQLTDTCARSPVRLQSQLVQIQSCELLPVQRQPRGLALSCTSHSPIPALANLLMNCDLIALKQVLTCTEYARQSHSLRINSLQLLLNGKLAKNQWVCMQATQRPCLTCHGHWVDACTVSGCEIGMFLGQSESYIRVLTEQHPCCLSLYNEHTTAWLLWYRCCQPVIVDGCWAPES